MAGRNDAEVVTIFEYWRARQKRPSVCRLTKDRKALISGRLSLGYEVSDILTLLEYAFEAKNSETRWWHGENPNGTRYLDLANLLRVEKLGARVERAWDWKMTLEENDGKPPDVEEDYGLRLVRGGKNDLDR